MKPTPPTTRPAFSRVCLPVHGPITDAHLARLFAEVPPVPPADPAEFAGVAWVWPTILSIGAALFGAGCWGIYRLFN